MHYVSPTLRLICLAGLVCLGIAGLGGDALGQAQRAEIPTVSAEIEIDGHADEIAWDGAGELNGFTIYSPTTESDAQFSARARSIRTDDAVFFLVEVDLRGGEVYAPVGRRDDASGDYVEIQLDPWNRAVHGYAFRVNASSVLADARIRQGGSKDFAWDSLFDARAALTEDGYSIEFRIPFQSLRFDPSDDEWGVHVYVNGHAAEQALSWAPIRRDDPDWFQQRGAITGLSGGETGRAIEFLPSITARVTQLGPASEDDAPTCDFELDPIDDHGCRAELDYGLGFKWGVSPSTTLDAVFNPDFSQIEADPGQLALNNRFALYLSERRPFFLEGRDIFNGPLGTVYTRSINRPLAATKISSQLRAGRLGTMIAYDRTPTDSVLDDDFAPSEVESETAALSTITRGVFDVTSDDSIALTLVSKQWFGDRASPYNLALAVDADTRIADRWWWRGAVAGSVSRDFQDDSLSGAAGSSRITYESETIRWFAVYDGYSSDYRAETGFVNRVDYNSVFTKLDGYYRSDNWWGRFVSPGYWAELVWDGDGDIADTELGTNIYWQFAQRIWFFSDFTRYGERYVEDLDSGGERDRWFEGNSFWFSFGVNTAPWLDIEPGISVRQTIIRDSELRDVGEPAFMGAELGPRLTVTLRPVEELTWVNRFTSRYLYRDFGGDRLVDITTGDSAAEPLYYSALSYFPRREFELRAIADWDINDSTLSSDFLFGWTPSPGNVLYVGYRQDDWIGAAQSDETRGLIERSVFLKFSRLFVR
ncbi:MAG: hypothetical protein ACJAYU_001991 [Bradymonadia bacterium]